MINRIVHEAAAPGNHLMQVAKLQSDVTVAAAGEAEKAALLNAEAPAKPAEVVTGADVDRLV
jgi:NADPH-dependent curcumin reductase CurA